METNRKPLARVAATPEGTTDSAIRLPLLSQIPPGS